MNLFYEKFRILFTLTFLVNLSISFGQNSLTSLACTCNNDQTVNMTDGTYNTVLVISNSTPLASGQMFNIETSTGLSNISGGTLGTASFAYCNGTGCPMGVTTGQYYLEVQVNASNNYSATATGGLTLTSTTCNPTYPPLPVIPIDDINCITSDVTFASSGGTYTFQGGFPNGFSQMGTGPLMIDYETFDPQNDNPYTAFLTTTSGGCNTTASKLFEVYKRPVTTLNARLYDCRKIGSTINLFEMLASNSNGNGKFYIGGTEVVSGSYTVTGNVCQNVTYRIADPKCGTIESMSNFQVTISPSPTFDLTASAASPVCMNGGSVTVSTTRTSTGTNPSWSVNGASMAGPNFNLTAPSSKGSNTYNICLTETNTAQPLCPGVVLPGGYQPCASTTCKKYTVYNDGYGCGANNIFSSQCEEFAATPCEANVNPTLELACGAIFSISLPFDIVTTGLDMDVSVIDCTDDEVCGHFNASLLGIDVPGGGGPKIKDLPGIGAICDIFGFCFTLDLGVTDLEFCPFEAIYNLLQCDKSLLEIIFDALATIVGGDGGEWKLVADTDGDGAFDHIVTGDDLGISQGFPSSSDFCVPNNVKGAGTINVRLVAGWPNAPTDVCGKVVTDGISLLELLPLGAIPIVGPIIEDIFATLNCDIDMAWSNYADAAVTVTNTSPPTFLNCNEAGYVFGQTPGCTNPVNWSIPLAISACDEHSLAYAGITDAVDVSYYVGTNLPSPVVIGGEGIYQTAGPIPGSTLVPGNYTVTYTAVSCNGNPTQCTFNITVLADVPPLVCPNDITLNTDAGQCTAFVNGLAPLSGLGGCYSILNYSFTDPVSGTIHTTTSDTPGTINTPSGHHFELGTTTITYTLLVDSNNDGDFDDAGETQTCSFTITVQDNEKPHAVCVDTEITLDNTGNFTVYADELANSIFVDGGSTDNCQTIELTISKDGTTWTESLNFDCSEEGPNYIKLRAVDSEGNESTCFAIVYVNDFFSDFTINLDVPEVCFEPFQNSIDFSPYLVIATPDGTNVSHQNVGTIGPNVVGNFGISGFLPDPGSTNDPGTITPDGVYTLGTGTGWITISYVVGIGDQINQIDGTDLAGCFKIVHDIFRVQKLDPVWNGGFMCCDQQPVWLGGAAWDGTGTPVIPAGMLSLTDIRGSYPGDVYGEWTGEGVTFVNPDGILYSGDEFFQFDPNGLDGTYTLTYIIGDEPCAFTYAQDIRVTCQDLHVDISDYTVCPANWVEEKQVLVNLDDKDLVVSTTGFDEIGLAGGHYANGAPVVDLDSVMVVDGRVVIPGFFAPVVRNMDFEICVTTFQTTPFGCADVFCYTITVQDLIAPEFQNCPKEPIVVDAPEGWCSSFVNFEYPWVNDNCMGLNAKIEQVDLTGLKSGDLFPVGLTILAYTSTDTVGNQSYCEIKIVVNDYHTPPSITCPANKTQVNDLNECGAIVNNIAPVEVDDNCLDNLTVLYEINDVTGASLACGFEDASGEFFPVGTSTVAYTVQDQPLLLITEVVQNGMVTGVEVTNFGPAALDLTCGKFLLKNAAGMVLDSFVIPTRNNKSTYGSTPIFPPDPVTWILPNPNIVPVGGTFTHNFSVNPAIGTVNKYCFKFLDRLIDEAIINDKVKGDVILRKNVCDHDLQTDFLPATPCDPGSYGMLNPGLPTMTPNGTTTSLQNYNPSTDKCTFNVTINDREAPTCIKHDSITVVSTSVPASILANTCFTSTITMPAGLVFDVNIHDLRINIANSGAITAYLNSPSGTRIKLFDGVCNGQPNVDIDLDETIVWVPAPSVVNALCNPLGRNSIYRPEESFKAFYGEEGGGAWTLELFTENGVLGSLVNWELEVLYQLPYDQPSVVLENAPGACDTTFTWIHPILEDNCCKGTINVSYTFTNDVTGESSFEESVILNSNGSINEQGLLVTKIFKVGKTIIEYTLNDQYGNLNTCGFMVTVLDTEKPVFTGSGCPPREIQLKPGECLGQLDYFTPNAKDNCKMDTITYCFEDGSPADISQLPIGSYNVIAKAKDIYGNIETCTFLVTVIEFIPTNHTLACNNNLNVSLGPDCQAILNADMILEGNNYRCYDNYCITITDLSGNIHENLFTLEDEGKTFRVSITDCVTNSGVSCWGFVTIEEKLIPEFVCPPDLTVACNIDVDARDINTDTLLTGEAKLLSCEIGANINWQDEWISYGQCDSPRAKVERTWTIIDSEGNRVECVQNITILPLNLDEIVFPDDLEFHQAINCVDVVNNPTLTDPNSTGWPILNGTLINQVGSLCMVSIHYTDEKYDICDGSYEILRYWKIRNMCLPVSSTNPRVHIQVIKVLDTSGPKLVDCPHDITVSVSPWSCSSAFELPLPKYVGDACSKNINFRYLIYGGGHLYSDFDSLGVEHVFVSDLTKGEYTVKYLYKDLCGNKSSCSFIITVIDASPPIPVAKQNLVMSLSGDANGQGSGKLYGWQVDNGSYDQCSNVRFELRRLAGGSCGNVGANGTHNNNSTYNDNNGYPSEVPDAVWFHPMDNAQDTDGGEFVKFCCEDIPAGADHGLHDVEMRVWDDGNMNGIYGDNDIIDGMKDNYNTTWVTIRVENKLPPTLICPKDVTVTCDMELNLSEGVDTKVSDVNLTMTGYPKAYDLCSNLDITYSDQWVGTHDPVCKSGTIRRTFKVTKGSIVVTCTQFITVTTITVPFTVTFPNQNGTTEWDKCSFSLEDARDAANASIKRPIVNYGQCDIVGENITIDTFLFEDGACKKWRVKYSYKNWCTGEEINTIAGLPIVHWYAFKDVTAPVLSCSNQMFAANPNPLNPNGGCEASVALEASASDALICAEESWIKWQMFFDGWNNGTVDRLGSSFVNKSWNGIWVPQAKYIAGVLNPTWVALQNQHPNLPLADLVYVTYIKPTKASGETVKLPVGTGSTAFILNAENINHKVLWKVTDGCGNVDQCESTVMVVDKKAPTPYCVSVSTALMQTSPKMVELWARDFDKGAFDNCSPQSKLYFTFEGAAPIYSRVNEEHFYKVVGGVSVNATAAEYAQGKAYKWLPSSRSAGKVFLECGKISVQINVWDEAWNTDFCSTEVDIIGCGTGNLVSGKVATALGNHVDSTLVSISANLPEYPKTFVTNEDGVFDFDVVTNTDYQLRASKDGDYSNGVTTLDLVLIQRHILGLEVFNDPYKVIAADANNDGKITASDLVEIRKLILGVTDKFKNASWRFPIKNQTLSAYQAIPYIEHYDYPQLNTDKANQDFVAVKIGDINSSVQTNILDDKVEGRTSKVLEFKVDDQQATAGHLIAIPVKASNFNEVFGFQFTGQIKNSQIDRIESGKLDVTDEMFAIHKDGKFTMSFASKSLQSVDAEQVLFTIYVRPSKNLSIQDNMSITSDITRAEYYDHTKEVGKLKLRFISGEIANFELFQNEPNPFKGQTTVMFTMPEAATATLSVHDVTGKVVAVRNISAMRGQNSEVFTKDQLGVSGVLYYTLKSGDFTATKKMIIVE